MSGPPPENELQRRRRFRNAEADGWQIRKTCSCEKPLERLVGGDGYITVVCLRCRRGFRGPARRTSHRTDPPARG